VSLSLWDISVLTLLTLSGNQYIQTLSNTYNLVNFTLKKNPVSQPHNTTAKINTYNLVFNLLKIYRTHVDRFFFKCIEIKRLNLFSSQMLSPVMNLPLWFPDIKVLTGTVAYGSPELRC
jgi:hypothetical protein